MFVKPGTDPETGLLLSVRDPRTMRLLPETGAEVPADDFYLRRLRDGDVILADAPIEGASA